MEAREKPDRDKEKSQGARKRKVPKGPLQPDIPMEEGLVRPSNPEAPPARAATRRVSEIMTEDPVCCLAGTPLIQVARMMAENSCGAIPVISSQDRRLPIGIVTDRDVAIRTVARHMNPLDMTAGEVMSPSPVTVASDESLDACMALMREHRIRRMVVVDNRGWVSGLIAMAQIARHLPKGDSGKTIQDISRPTPEG